MKLLKLLDSLLTKSVLSIFTFLGVVSAILSVISVFLSIAGIKGSIELLVVSLLLCFLLTSSILVLKFFRWNLIEWALRKHIEPIKDWNPWLIIGLGRGGGIVAAIVSKILSEELSKEALFTVLDRRYEFAENCLNVNVDSENFGGEFVRESHEGVALLVSAEVHGGDTIKAASKYLNSVGIKHKTFTYLKSPMARVKLDHYVLETPYRNLLPWPPAKMHKDLDNKMVNSLR